MEQQKLNNAIKIMKGKNGGAFYARYIFDMSSGSGWIQMVIEYPTGELAEVTIHKNICEIAKETIPGESIKESTIYTDKRSNSEKGMKINTNNEKLNSIFSVIINEGRLDYSQDDYHVLINYLVDRINSHKPEKRIQVVIIDDMLEESIRDVYPGAEIAINDSNMSISFKTENFAGYMKPNSKVLRDIADYSSNVSYINMVDIRIINENKKTDNPFYVIENIHVVNLHYHQWKFKQRIVSGKVIENKNQIISF